MENETYKDFLNVDWRTNRPRILLFADIMGFKNKAFSKTHSQLVVEFKKFIEELTKLMEPLETGRHLRLTMFSDSIIMGADSCTIRNFNIIVKAAAILLNLCHKHSLPINGCISCGNLTFEEQIQTSEQEAEVKGKRKIRPYMPLFIGDSVVKAFLLNEDLFCYGIVLHPTAEKLFMASQNHSDSKYHHSFYYLPVALKSGGNAYLYYLSWTDVSTPINPSKEVSYNEILTWLKNIESETSVRARAYINNTRNLINCISLKSNLAIENK